MAKNYSNNQTQFGIEEPILDGQTRMPKAEKVVVGPIDTVQIALVKKRQLLIIGATGLVLVVIGVLVLIGMNLGSGQVIPQISDQSPTPTPEVVDLSLREQIDLLTNQVEQFEKPSRSLVFPSVETDIRINELK
ncbi:hypothetical protein KKF92_01060 [Patescibacteria group bacterium]|nr:hypothetical protein [Patescibacteria group bacterium]